MIVKSFPLLRPNVFADDFRELNHHDDEVLVRPRLLSICAADLRYYLGLRPASVLAEKLPMILIHEAIGTIVKAPVDSGIKVGDSAILLPCGCGAKQGTNYQDKAFFRSSNADGFCQELISLQPEEIVLLSNQFDSEPFVFSELLSVCFQALRQIKDEVSTAKCVGVWGDGSLGYLMSLLIKSLYPEKHVSVIGKHEDRLEKFAFANEVETIFSRSNRKYDVLVECVGGNGAQIAINDMIDHSIPNATLLLTGVSEVSPVINTRKILEKGLTLRGTTRSIREDFILANNFLKSDKNRCLVKVLDTKRCDVHTSIDLRNAFEEAKVSKFKTTINFLP